MNIEKSQSIKKKLIKFAVFLLEKGSEIKFEILSY